MISVYYKRLLVSSPACRVDDRNKRKKNSLWKKKKKNKHIWIRYKFAYNYFETHWILYWVSFYKKLLCVCSFTNQTFKKLCCNAGITAWLQVFLP